MAVAGHAVARVSTLASAASTHLGGNKLEAVSPSTPFPSPASSQTEPHTHLFSCSESPPPQLWTADSAFLSAFNAVTLQGPMG